MIQKREHLTDRQPLLPGAAAAEQGSQEHEVLECSVNTSTVQYGTVLYWVLGAQFYVPNLGVASSGCFQYQKQVDMLAKGQQIHKREFSGPPSKGRLLSVCQPQT